MLYTSLPLLSIRHKPSLTLAYTYTSQYRAINQETTHHSRLTNSSLAPSRVRVADKYKTSVPCPAGNTSDLWLSSLSTKEI